MKVQLLLLEGIEKEIEDDVKEQLSQSNIPTDNYEKVLAEMEGRNTEENTTIFVDITKFYKITDFYFRKTDVRGLFMSTKLTKREHKIMVIIIENQEYDCIFDETIFEELKEFLNN